MLKKFFCIFFLLTGFSQSFASQHNAPAGIMADHIHKKGKTMGMGLIKHTNNSTFHNTTKQKAMMQYPTIMESEKMTMVMYGLMHGITNNVNIMIMAHAMKHSMETHHHEHSMGGEMGHTIHKHGHGGSFEFHDAELTMLFKLIQKDGIRSQINLGHTLVKDAFASAFFKSQYVLAYNKNGLDAGLQTTASIRSKSNTEGYKHGNSYEITAWLAKDISNTISASTRLQYINQKADQFNPPSMISSPWNNPKLTFNKQLNLLLGLGFQPKHGLQLLIEGGTPLHQQTGTAMLKNDYSIIFTIRHNLY